MRTALEMQRARSMADGSLAHPEPGLAGSRPAVRASFSVKPISHSLPSYFQMAMAAFESNCFQRTLPPRTRYPASMASERMLKDPLMMWYSRLKSNGVFFSAAHCHAMSLPCSTLVHPSMPDDAIHSPIFSMAVMGSEILSYISDDGVVVAIAFICLVGFGASARPHRSGPG